MDTRLIKRATFVNVFLPQSSLKLARRRQSRASTTPSPRMPPRRYYLSPGWSSKTRENDDASPRRPPPTKARVRARPSSLLFFSKEKDDDGRVVRVVVRLIIRDAALLPNRCFVFTISNKAASRERERETHENDKIKSDARLFNAKNADRIRGPSLWNCTYKSATRKEEL